MALDATRKQEIRKYLGYSGRYHQVQTECEMGINAINAAADANLEANITEVLDALNANWKRLYGSSADNYTTNPLARAKYSSVSDAGDQIVFRGPAEVSMIRDHARGLVQALHTLTGIPIKDQIFGVAGVGGGLMRMG